jgi:hypothetical protein
MIVAVSIVSVTLILFLVFAIIHRTLFPCLEPEKIKKRLSRDGIEAEAVLLRMEQTGFYMNNLPQVRLKIKVQPKNGRIFVSETREIMSLVDMAQLPVGSTVKVKYNPCNMNEIMLVR